MCLVLRPAVGRNSSVVNKNIRSPSSAVAGLQAKSHAARTGEAVSRLVATTSSTALSAVAPRPLPTAATAAILPEFFVCDSDLNKRTRHASLACSGNLGSITDHLSGLHLTHSETAASLKPRAVSAFMSSDGTGTRCLCLRLTRAHRRVRPPPL